MSKLTATIARAAELAYEEDETQIIGRIDGRWEIADAEDVGRQAQMTGGKYRVSSWGMEPEDMTEAMIEDQ